jgi:CDP-diacylglycerol pyrophosphatase
MIGNCSRSAASRIVAVLCIGATFAFGAQAAAMDASRSALWKVVQACLINHGLMGAAFPCLEVNVSDQTGRGYAILRLPFGASDPMLAPTRGIVGVEDPSLEALDAPN